MGFARTRGHCRQMPEVAPNRGERNSPQQPRGEILENRVETVAFYIVGFERSRATGRIRIMVFHYGARHVAAFPSCPSGAQPEGGIRAVQKEALVEKADLIEHASPVKRRRAARQKSFRGVRKVSGGSLVSTLLARSVG